MSLLQLQFRLKPINGWIGTATQTNPSGFVGKSFYYEIVQGGSSDYNSLGVQNNIIGQGRVIGLITYDYFQSRWAVLFTVGDVVLPAQIDNATAYYKTMSSQITDFLTQIQNGSGANGWPQPVATDAIGDLYPYPASLPPIKS